VRPGRQIIEFTPEKIGVIPFSCWMGMLRGDFQVVEEPPNAKKEAQTSISATVSENRGEIASEKPPPAIAGRSERYTIMPGDTLTRIAGRIYHDARKWREIAHSNPGLNPRRLQPGQTLSLLVSTGDETRPCNKP
jgi:nucleoid-associated protein YgaU